MILDNPSLVERTGDDTPARGLYPYVWRMSGWRQGVPVALALGVAALGVVPLELQRRIVDDAIAAGNTELLFWLASLYLGAIAASGVLKFALRLSEGWLAESAIRYCRRHLAELTDRKLNGGQKKADGALLSILRAEIEQVGGFVGNALSEPAAHLGMMLATMIYMFMVQPVIALACLGLLVPQVLVAPIIQRYINRLTEQRIETLRHLSESAAMVQEGAYDPDRLDGETMLLYRNRMRIIAWKFFGKAILNLLNAAAPLGALTIGGWMVIQGETQLGVVLAFTTGFSRLSDPARSLIAYYRLAARTRVAHEKIAEWM
ncbi:ABC transporter ATP-binding protein [Rhodobacteraceae bacterium NNCM2]|nr:ABC transporter ATP-binding protein [Coraliihabitans acroporae]